MFCPIGVFLLVSVMILINSFASLSHLIFLTNIWGNLYCSGLFKSISIFQTMYSIAMLNTVGTSLLGVIAIEFSQLNFTPFAGIVSSDQVHL